MRHADHGSDPAAVTPAPSPPAQPLTPLRPADAPQVPALAAVLAAAFRHDPVWSFLLPDQRDRQRRLQRFFEVELSTVGTPRGAVHTVGDRSAVGVLLPPGAWRMPPPVMARQAPAFVSAFGRSIPRVLRHLHRVERLHPRWPHHYLAYLGVTPAAQGQGVGTTMLRSLLASCDATGLPVYLEASSHRNAALYRRLGFHTLHRLDYGGGEPLHLMLRPAQTPAQPTP